MFKVKSLQEVWAEVNAGKVNEADNESALDESISDKDIYKLVLDYAKSKKLYEDKEAFKAIGELYWSKLKNTYDFSAASIAEVHEKVSHVEYSGTLKLWDAKVRYADAPKEFLVLTAAIKFVGKKVFFTYDYSEDFSSKKHEITDKKLIESLYKYMIESSKNTKEATREEYRKLLSSLTESVSEGSGWDDTAKAAHDIFILLERNKIKAKISGVTGVKVKHDNGSVGTLVFDPQNKW